MVSFLNISGDHRLPHFLTLPLKTDHVISYVEPTSYRFNI